jgi:hypothetical protein
VVRELFQIGMGPDSGVLGHERESRRNHFELIQEFFSCLIDDTGTIGPVLEKPFVAFYSNVESTAKKTGGLRVFAFKTGGFLDH